MLYLLCLYNYNNIISITLSAITITLNTIILLCCYYLARLYTDSTEIATRYGRKNDFSTGKSCTDCIIWHFQQ